jgi:pentatricopeptide repeat protein
MMRISHTQLSLAVNGGSKMRLSAQNLAPSRAPVIKNVMRYMIRDILPEEEEESPISNADTILMKTTRRIKELGERGRAKEAITLMAGLAEQGVQPDTVCATTLVRACSRDMSLAQSVFDELFGSFLQPDEVSFAVLLRGYGSKTPPDWVKIDKTLSAMKAKEVDPTATSFNALLEICVRTNDLERGQEIIERMSSDGVEPDEFTLDVVSKRKVLRSSIKKAFQI